MDSPEATSHKEVRGSQIVKSKQDTCSVLQAISNFTNPFTIEDKDALYCLSFGAPVPQDVESDILMADDIDRKEGPSEVCPEKSGREEDHLSLSSKETESQNVCYPSKIINSLRKGKKKHRNNSREKLLWATGDTGARASSSLGKHAELSIGPGPLGTRFCRWCSDND